MAQCRSEPASSRRPSATSEVLQSKRTFLFPNETKEISVEHGLKALREFDGNGGDINNYENRDHQKLIEKDNERASESLPPLEPATTTGRGSVVSNATHSSVMSS